MSRIDGPAIVVANAGEINTGTFDNWATGPTDLDILKQTVVGIGRQFHRQP